MSKLNNIFEYININDCLNSNIIDNYDFEEDSKFSYILNNSIIISELNDYENSYSLYYKTDEDLFLLSYLVKEGNGLYNYEAYHSLFFNIDDNSIRESYYKIFVDTNSISFGNDNSYNYGISYIDNTYLINYKNSISVNNEIISYFVNIKNRMNDIYDKYKDIYKRISYYNTISKTYNSIYDYDINYDYKDIVIKFIDNYYFTNDILNPDYKDFYITLSNDNNMIYFKNINLLNISLEITSDFKEKISNIINHNGIVIPTNTDINAVLSKSNNSSYFPILNSICNDKKSESINNYSKKIVSYNTIHLANDIESQQNLLKNHGGEILIKIEPQSLSYVNNNYISNYTYGLVLNESTQTEEEILSLTKSPFETITKYEPTINKIKLAFDNRNITHGVSLYNTSIENSYILLMDLKVVGDIPITNTKLINKLLNSNIIWYNYDKVLHYGYNISYINTRDNLYKKNYTPIFQNISTKIVNFNFLNKYLLDSNPLPNIDIMDFENVIASDMSSFVYSNTVTRKYVYVYKYIPSEHKITIIEEVNDGSLVQSNKIIL